MDHLIENINRIKTIMNIRENKQVYPYGCVMLYFDESDVNNLHSEINPQDLYTEGDGFGIEESPHCTLLYGLHDDEIDIEDIQEVLDNHTYSTLKAHNLSVFERPNYDVLKYDIKGKSLKETNDELKEFPYTSEFPSYHPHMTIAYLKPGRGREYVNELSKKYDEMLVTPQYAIYSDPKGGKYKLPIQVK